MKNENKKMNRPLNIETESVAAEASAKKPRSPYYGRFVMLISLLVALSILASALAVFTFGDFSKKNKPTVQTGFVYRDAKISDYIALTEQLLTGYTVPGADVALDPVTEKTVRQYIDTLLLSNVALTTKEKQSGAYETRRSTPIGYADELSLYVLYVENEAGEQVLDKFFNNAYMDMGFFQVGMEAFGPAFDDALIGKRPMDIGSFEAVTMGSIDADDVICITYTVTEKIPVETEDAATADADDEEEEETYTKIHKNVTGLRVDLGRLTDEEDVKWRDALLKNYGTIGQSFSFEIEEDADEDGDKETVTYEGVIASKIVNEEPCVLTVTLPEDYFGSAPTDEDRKALNGATVKFYVIAEFLVDHEANTSETMDKADMINTLGFTPSNLSKLDKTKDDYEAECEKAREECVAHFTKQMEQSHKETTESMTLSLIWNHLLDTLDFTGALPEEAIEEMKTSLRQQVESAYSQYSTQSAFLEQFPNIDLYAASSYMWNYDVKDYEDYEDYIDNYLAARSVKQQLLVFGIYETVLKDKKALNAKYEELIVEVIDNSTTETETPTRKEVIEYFEKYYGKHYLKDQAKLELVNDYLAEKNTIDWNTYKESGK